MLSLWLVVAGLVVGSVTRWLMLVLGMLDIRIRDGRRLGRIVRWICRMCKCDFFFLSAWGGGLA